MINARKKLSNVALEHPAGSGVVFTYDISELSESIYRLVHPPVLSAGERISNECPVKKRVEDSVKRMMEQSVTHACFVDISWLGV